MDDDILFSIKQYCTEHGCLKTAKKIKIECEAKTPKLEEVFKGIDNGNKRKIKVYFMNLTLEKWFFYQLRIEFTEQKFICILGWISFAL